MLKLLLFVAGLAAGAAGAIAWLLAAPASDMTATGPMSERLQILKARLEAAQAEGAAAAEATENQLRHELETYRRHPDRPATSS